MTYTVYILYSEKNDLFYKGQTSNLDSRIFQHNSDLSRYTAGKGPWKCVYTRVFKDKRDALIEEKRLKRLNKASLLKLIENQ